MDVLMECIGKEGYGDVCDICESQLMQWIMILCNFLVACIHGRRMQTFAVS